MTLTAERWQRVRQALDRAAELGPQERAEFLSRLRQGDAETAVEVEALLGQENREESWLDRALSRRGDITLPAQPGDRSASDRAEEWPARTGVYAIEGELARGGMGVVLRARDERFDRAVAVKILARHFAGDSAMVQRFLDEAQLMGRMQHPGIPPVHDRGELPDGRPYLAMKLIKGHTLAQLMRDGEKELERTKTDSSFRAQAQSRWLPIFEQICHAIAYAHSRGVIHRDLKPSNIMVGAFGEVQVMDWGLAKVIKPGAGERDFGAAAAKASEPPSTFFLAAAALGREETVAGSVMGTLAYMAPEQARGEIDALDERCDVFGLGAILCEILTGAPPFSAASDGDSIRLARAGDVTPAFARLDAGGADAELRLLAKKCLAPDRHDRPANAQAVAETIRLYQAELQRRLRKAEIEQTAARVRAEEESKRRVIGRRWAALVALLALVAGATGAWFFVERDRAEEAARNKLREKDIAAALDREEQHAMQLHRRLADYDLAHELIGDPDVWKQSLDQRQEALVQAGRLLAGGPRGLDPALPKRIQVQRDRLELDLADFDLGKELDDLHLESFAFLEDRPAPATTKPKYARFFAEQMGLDVESGNPATLAERIRASRLRQVLLAALDHWAALSADSDLLPRLLRLVQLVDPDPWRDRFRREATWKDRKQLETLAAEVLPARQSPQVLMALAGSLERNHGNGQAVLETALVHHPHSFWLNLTMASHLRYSTEKAGYCQAALAIRPRSSVAWNILGAALVKQHKHHEALGALKKAAEMNPKDGIPHRLIGKILQLQGRFADAERASQKALDLMAENHPLRPEALEQCNECRRCLDLQRQEKLQAVEDWKSPMGLTGRLDPKDPLDLYLGLSKSPRKSHAVRLEGGKHYEIDLRSRSPGFDPILRIETADWKPLVESDDIRHLEELNSRLLFTPKECGVYRLIVNGYKLKTASDYALTVREAMPNAPQLIPGELTKYSEKVNGKHVEKHKLAVAAETRYVIELESGRFDPYLRLLDAKEKLLAVNDDVAPGNFQQSRIDFTPRDSGTYLLEVTSYQVGETGVYALRIHSYRPPR